MVMGGSAFKFPPATRIGDTKMPDTGQRESFEERLNRLKNQVLDMKELDMLGQGLMPGQAASSPKDAGFKVTGGIDMGTYDLQAREREANERLERARQEESQRVSVLTEELSKSKAENQAMMMSNAIAAIGDKFTTAIQAMDRKIEAYGAGAQGSSIEKIVGEFEVLTKMAEKFGQIGRPQGTPSTGDPILMLKIEEIKLNAAREERRFQLEMEDIKRKNEIEMLRFQDDRTFRREELAQKRENMAMLAKAPEILGGAIAQGLMNMSGGEAPIAARAPAARPTNSVNKKITAGPGESGTVECPDCGELMAIPPDATQTICAGCSNTYPIQRTPVNA